MTADRPWINPVGGLGDTLMLAGVLKHVVDRDPDARYHLVARTKYGPLLSGHPALIDIGHPPLGAMAIATDYWSQPDYGSPDHPRAYQLLARMLGLPTPVPEVLYVPWAMQPDPVLRAMIPWRARNVALCPTSVSPRKHAPQALWEALAARLSAEGALVVQLGERADRYVRGAYSLLGLTTPRQLVSLLDAFDVVVTCDNFAMHAAALRRVPAVVLFGPTRHEVYAYSGQRVLQAEPGCDLAPGCVGPTHGDLYCTPCPHGDRKCMAQHTLETVTAAVHRGVQPSGAGVA